MSGMRGQGVPPDVEAMAEQLWELRERQRAASNPTGTYRLRPWSSVSPATANRYRAQAREVLTLPAELEDDRA